MPRRKSCGSILRSGLAAFGPVPPIGLLRVDALRVPAETPAALHPHIASLDNPQAMVASQSAMAAFDPVAADLGEKIERIDVAAISELLPEHFNSGPALWSAWTSFITGFE